jgi:asparagine synthase (glutamine-hydrolysing)
VPPRREQAESLSGLLLMRPGAGAGPSPDYQPSGDPLRGSMRGLCGLFCGVGEDARHALAQMLEAGGTPIDKALHQGEPSAALAVFGEIAQPTLYQSDDLLIALAGHPRVRGAGTAPNKRIESIAKLIRERGARALVELGGDFSLAVWDRSRRRGLLAVDRIGVHPLVYAKTDRGLVFASTLDFLAGHPQVQRSLSTQALYDYLYYHVVPGPETIFEQQFRLAAGHYLEFDERGASNPQCYWLTRFTEDPGDALPTLEQQFVDLLEQSVRDATEGATACGSFLSGGTDSSTVSGMLGRVLGTQPDTFSIGFDAAGFDETEYARIATRHFGLKAHEYFVTPADVVDAVPKIAAAYDQPFGNASAVPTYYCARLAREHGIERMLAGDGGDELFGGNERYAKQHILGLYHRLPALVREQLIERVLPLNRPASDVPLLKKLRSYVQQAHPPMPRRYESYNLLEHLGVQQVLDPGFLDAVDTRHPQMLMNETHAPYAKDSLVNQMLGIDMRFILADGDLPKVTHMCNLAGVDVAFPLLDDRLIDFASRLPARYKLRGTHLRWFFKHALRNFLPREIIDKRKHGFGLPVGRWLLDHAPLRALATDAIASLRPRGILRPGFTDDLIERKLPEHPNYFGTMIWILMMLGLWLESRRL